MEKYSPYSLHTENWIIASGYKWKKVGSIEWTKISHIAEKNFSMWTNGYKTYHGLNDEFSKNFAANHSKSISTIIVEKLIVDVITDFNGNKKVYAKFEYNKNIYRLHLTDPYYEYTFKNGNVNQYNFGESLITVSLSEEFKKNDESVCHYKLVAALLPKP